MIYGTSYERFYGKYTSINSGEAEILKYKKFSEIKLATILNHMAITYIDSWVMLKDDKQYVNLCL